MYLNDRQRVEIGLPAHMMLAAFLSGVSEQEQTSEEFKRIRADLIEAGSDPVSDLIDKHAVKVLNRTRRVLDEITQEHTKPGEDVAKVALITFHFMKIIIEDNYLQYKEGCAFDRSIQAFMEALEPRASIEAANNAAIKQAGRMLRQLQEMGYYGTVEVP